MPDLLAVVPDAEGMHRPLAPLLAAVLLAALAGCSSTPAPVASKAHPASEAAAPITGVALDKIEAWGECQQLVTKKLKPTADAPISWSKQSTSGTAAHMVAVGHATTGSLAYRYQCTIAFTAKADVSSESLDWIYPA